MLMDQQTLEVPEQMLSPAAKRLRDVQAEIIAMRNAPKPVYIAPPIPAAIAEKTRIEQEEGRRLVSLSKARQEALPVKPKDKADGTVVPVYRPGDFVPNFKQGDAVNKSYKTI